MSDSYCEASLSLALIVIVLVLFCVLVHVLRCMCVHQTVDIQCVFYAEAYNMMEYRRTRYPYVETWFTNRYKPSSDDVITEFDGGDDEKGDDSKLDAM